MIAVAARTYTSFIPVDLAGYIIGTGGAGRNEILTRCGVRFDVEPREAVSSAWQRVRILTPRCVCTCVCVRVCARVCVCVCVCMCVYAPRFIVT